MRTSPPASALRATAGATCARASPQMSDNATCRSVSSCASTPSNAAPPPGTEMHTDDMNVAACIEHEISRLRAVHDGAVECHPDTIGRIREHPQIVGGEIERKIDTAGGQRALTLAIGVAAAHVPELVDERRQRRCGPIAEHLHGELHRRSGSARRSVCPAKARPSRSGSRQHLSPAAARRATACDSSVLARPHDLRRPQQFRADRRASPPGPRRD